MLQENSNVKYQKKSSFFAFITQDNLREIQNLANGNSALILENIQKDLVGEEIDFMFENAIECYNRAEHKENTHLVADWSSIWDDQHVESLDA